MKRVLLLMVLASLCFGQSVGLLAKADEEPVSSAHVRDMADGLSGIRVNGGQVADKVVYLGRNAKGELVILGIAALAPGMNEGIEPVDGSIAILRTRAATSNGNSEPESADYALAKSSGLSLYIIGEWSDPPKLWQIKPEQGGIMVREIDRSGKAGDWRAAGA